jgi:predicted RNase H-like nuclease (RuvC/YqgF family)
LKSEIISLVNINEENTRRIDEFNDEKFNFEQELNEKDRQIKEYDEKIQELELTLERTKENSAKLRNALEKARESMTNNEQTKLQDAGNIFYVNFSLKTKIFSSENRLRKLTEQYEERLKQQEIEYNTNLKAMAKEMNTQIDEKEQNYNQQLRDFIRKIFILLIE